MDVLKLRAATFGSALLLGVVGAIALQKPPAWEPLFLPTVAPAPAAEPARPQTATATPLSPELATHLQAFSAAGERVITVGQELRRVEGQIHLQRTAYEEFMKRNAPFDLAAWHARQDELAQQRDELQREMSQANAEYERYVCKDGRVRAECWH